MSALGLVTIGQSPRDDVVPELRPFLPPDVTIVEAGALDGLAPEDIARQRPTSASATLVTRLSDGTQVLMDKGIIHDRIDTLIHRLAEEVDLIGLLCSGSFPKLIAKVPIVVPNKLLEGVVPALSSEAPVGVVVPSPDQIEPAVEELGAWGVKAIGRAASPYAEADRVGAAAGELAQAGVSAILLHCFGYSLAMRKDVRAVFPGPIIMIRTLFARVLAELLS